MGGAALETSEVLALDRTRLAAERTLMAWLRTALSMISFGFWSGTRRKESFTNASAGSTVFEPSP